MATTAAMMSGQGLLGPRGARFLAENSHRYLSFTSALWIRSNVCGFGLTAVLGNRLGWKF